MTFDGEYLWSVTGFNLYKLDPKTGDINKQMIGKVVNLETLNTLTNGYGSCFKSAGAEF